MGKKNENSITNAESQSKRKKAKHADADNLTSGCSKEEGIEFLQEFEKAKLEWPKDMERIFSSELGDDRRAELFQMMCLQGDLLRRRYSWAIPDERALKAVANFGPIIEVGCGLGYWAKLLRDRGVNVAAYDILADESRKAKSMEDPKKTQANDQEGGSQSEEEEESRAFWTEVEPGGPEMLLKESNKGRNLFLCYPDDYEDSEESLALNCLKKFTGDYVIHVGELFGQTLSCRQAPWGRTSDPNFQEHLCSTFHQVLQLGLPHWPHSRDTLTVWKRTISVPVDLEENEQETEQYEDTDVGPTNGGGEEDIWANIPPEERIPSDIAAPYLSHLLRN
mmetsp:Transcript_25627/g.33553  ORF Transcript_25627/g.33553 Transcript_25627/m.33553 type:complete len:336 (+) Transcript_25627:48-1055(+)|eukprot:CAMPEP_0117734976 /NCGR_PEP_ID=MMETSP0947-20121206/1007_1 /TAXON_ID=44440 /ORGANISM="Chattonella subsalsa, Strain CCMP2191" /LENGTH=335 /DNA_ID=CAMNT_0005549883 /DNA_START=16 /DNA_END=1023 /DNA_ORIENTATION=+